MYSRSKILNLLELKITESIPFYKMQLDLSEKKTYDLIVNGLIQYKNRIKVNNHSFGSLEKIVDYVCLDNPLLFYTKGFKFYQYGENCEVIPCYRLTKEKAEDTLLVVFNTLNEFIKDYKCQNEFHKEIAVHNTICKNIKYFDSGLGSDHECVGPLVFRSGVCDGISKAAKVMFDLLGVENYLVRGETNSVFSDFMHENHMWNIVKVNNKYYHLDITFDLSLMQHDIIRYDYFNLSNNQISKDHALKDSNTTQKCIHSWDYYKNNGLSFSEIAKFKSFLESSINERKKDIVFQIPTNSFENNLSVLTQNIEKYLKSFSQFNGFEIYHNSISGVCHLHMK